MQELLTLADSFSDVPALYITISSHSNITFRRKSAVDQLKSLVFLAAFALEFDSRAS